METSQCCQLQKLNDCTRLSLHGETMITEAKVLKEVLTEAVNLSKPIQIDLSELIELDIATLQLLFSAKKFASEKDISLDLLNPSKTIEQLITCSGIMMKGV